LLVRPRIFALNPASPTPLASLDHLKRVVYIGSYSKTISPNIRVGYLVTHPDVLDELAQLKMVSGLTSSDLNERLAFGALTEGGFELYCEPKAGMYLWARHPDLPDCIELSERALGSGLLLGPGHLFQRGVQRRASRSVTRPRLEHRISPQSALGRSSIRCCADGFRRGDCSLVAARNWHRPHKARWLG